MSEEGGGLGRLPDLVAEEVRRDDAVTGVHPHGHPIHDDALLAAGEHEAVEQRIGWTGAGNAFDACAGKRCDKPRERPLEIGPRAHVVSSP